MFYNFQYGWYAHPVVFGDYPEIMKTKIAKRSKHQGFSRSRLPAFTPVETEMMKGTYDFICLNSYTSRLVRALANPNMTAIDWDYDAEVYYYQPDTWESTNESFMKVNTVFFGKFRNQKFEPRLYCLIINISSDKGFFDTIPPSFFISSKNLKM